MEDPNCSERCAERAQSGASAVSSTGSDSYLADPELVDVTEDNDVEPEQDSGYLQSNLQMRKVSRISGRSALSYVASASYNTLSLGYGFLGFSGDSYAKVVLEKSLMYSLENRPSDDRFTPSFNMFLSLLSMLLSLTFFALPYLVGHGGLTMAGSIAAGGILTGYSALLLNTCQYQKSRNGINKRVYSTYIELGKASFKRHGEAIMKGIVACNVLTDTYYLIFCGQVFLDLFNNLVDWDKRTWMVIWMAVVLPMFFIKRMSILSWFSMLALLFYTSCLVLSFGILLSNFERWQWSNINKPFSFEYFFVGYGIILNSHNIHIAIPAMEACTKYPESFRFVQKSAWFVNIILKVSVAIMTAAAFGSATKGSFLVNLSQFGITSTVLNALIAVYLYCQFPTSMFVVLEMMDNYLQPKFYLLRKESKGHYIWMLMSRLCTALFVLFIAVCIPNFELVASFVGNLRGTLTTIVFPVIFYLRIKKREVSRVSRTLHMVLVVVACLCGLAGMSFAIKGMVVGQAVVAG